MSKLGRVAIHVFIIVLALLGIRAVVGYRTYKTLVETHDLLHHMTAVYTTVLSLRDIQDILFDAETGVRAYAITGKEASSAPFTKAKSAVESKFSEIRRLVQESRPEQTAMWEELEGQARQTMAYEERIINLLKAGKHDEAVALIEADPGVRLMEDSRRKVTEIIGTALSDIGPKHEAFDQAVFSSMIVVAGGLLLAIFVYFFLLFYIFRQVVRPIRSVMTTIANASTEIAATVEQQEKTAFSQPAAVGEAAMTIGELERSFRDMDEAANAAGARANQAILLAEDGSKIVDQSLAGITDLQEKVSAIAGQILQLSEQTNQIGAVINLVSDLASQTNMLALNAAVEAARAGEHGKGFAVVAAEIRKLADQSRKSAEKVNTLVADVRKATDATVMVTEEGTQTAAQGMALAQSTAAAFHSLRASLGTLVENFRQTQSSIEQQLTAVRHLAQAMKAGIDQLQDAVRKLAEIV
jgi:methyl-accepting chemotaxis protein